MTAVTEMAPNVLEHAGADAGGDQYDDATALILDIKRILVTDRYRKDLGDVSSLARSITEIGLLNPITVREWHGGYRLVAGERRLTAFKQLGLTRIPVRVARDIADARDALVAERDENTARKEMLPTEAALLGMAIEEIEKPAAKARQGSRNDIHSATGGGMSGHESREIAAEAVGLTRGTYVNIKTAITVARNEEEPQYVRDVALDALGRIDRGEPIRPNVDRIRAARAEEPPPAPKPRANDALALLTRLVADYPTLRLAFEAGGSEHYASTGSLDGAVRNAGLSWRFTEKQWQARVSRSAEVLDRSSMGIEVALSAINDVVDLATITPQQASQALERLDASALNRLIKKLKEISNV
ncbi:ParB/RepB/Spo0J family partition protein [Microbacterium hydrothermale]|uniref:ParB N-terminal domain-containing protein n=1 Tax=Microbacterium hydrothermale TaxID=857427 RepID=UPI002226C284|nr:ParB N-terminal domain-containing protein [Microbacterium hydrothermale]MCW2165365.1 ParB/RepB/Spo0J family partition protein [Microbacterium hydrothermale]